MSTAKTTTPTSSNQQLLPLYTEWTNRQLSRVSHRPVNDLSTELRDYRVVAAVSQAVLGDPQRVAAFRQALSTVNSNIDGLNVCLRHLQLVGVNCHRVTATEIDAGQLGSVLQLLYSLHNFKQAQRRELRPPPSPAAMAPSATATVSKLPSVPRSSRLQPPTSRLATPTKIAPPSASPARTSTISATPPSPSPKVKSSTSSTTALRAPSAIRPPSGNNNGSVSGVSTFSSTSSSSSAAPSAKKKLTQLQPPGRVSAVAAPAATAQPAQSKMLKLKLFSNKDNSKTAAPKTALVKEVPKKEVKKELKKPETSLRAPTRTSRLAPPSKTSTTSVHLRPTAPSIVAPSPEKRTSKSSEEESGYAGFGSTSPASSTQSSISLRSASSKGSSELVCEPEPLESQKEKPMMAVRALGMSPSNSPGPSVAPAPSPSMETVSSPSSQPTRCEKTCETPTVGVVSPIVQRKAGDECPPSSSKPEEKVKPAVPVRKDSRLLEPDESPVVPPSMSPSLPTYAQLLREGRIQTSRAESRFDSSTSEDSLDSVTTTIRLKPSVGGCCSEGNTLDRNYRARSSEPSGYTSEGGFAIYQKMQERMKECRDSVRRAHFDYGDSFEDSSSLSSGISDNFEDISTDDLSGPDHPMAKVAAAYASSCDYQPFTRSTSAKGPRSSSTSIDSRAKRIAEQENLHALLQQCRTSQRGAGTLRTPFSPQLVLSAEAEALRSRSRSTADQTVPTSHGYHSLDRKTHLAEFYGSGWNDRAAMALVSPRRVPYPRPSLNTSPTSATASSLSAGGMSRSMVLLESASPRPSRRRDSPRSRGRLQLSVASKGSKEAGYASYGEIQLHRLADEVRNKDPMGSQLSLASSSAYASLNEKYENEIRKMSRELDGYRQTVHKLTRKHDDYAQMMDMFNQRLSSLARHVEKAQLKPDEVGRLRLEIDNLRAMSGRVAQTHETRKAVEGAGELLRQPSLESVASMASHRSSMSSSSKSSKADKSSLNSFGSKSKKSWASNVDVQIRSSFTKAFSKKKNKGSDIDGSPLHLQTISGSQSRLDEVEVDELKRQLEDRDVALTDVRLDALDRAREVDLLRETVNRLKNENKQLKHDMSRLLARSRASSQASLAMHDEEPVYEVPPATSGSTPSSKRSSGCNPVKVTVNVDLRGVISSAICPDNEIIIGFLAMPQSQTTWGEIDQQIYALFDTYIGRIDADRLLGLHRSESVIGYQIGSVVREMGRSEPGTQPSEVIASTTTVRLFLKGASQKTVDSLVLETLFPMTMLEQLLRFLLTHRRLVLSGATGIGKSNLARQLASYMALRIGQKADMVHDIKIPDESENKAIVKVEKQLETLLKGSEQAVILLDNIPRSRIGFVSSVIASIQFGNDAGPFVICTVNRACQLPEMQVQNNFKIFRLTNEMEGVKGFMGRFLRRRLIEAEFRLSRQTPAELLRVIAFLPEVLQAVNIFIEKANSIEVTVGPRIFLQCPLGVEESRDWFVDLWNKNIIPYMVRVAREGVKVFGRCGSLQEDPTEVVCDKWPWTTGPTGEELLSRLQIKDFGQPVKQPFNPLDTLIRLQAAKAVDHV